MKKKFVISYKNMMTVFFCFFVMFPLLPLEGLSFLKPQIYKFLYSYLPLISIMLCGCAMFLMVMSKKKISSPVIWITVLAVYNICLTVFCHGDILSAITVWIYSIPMLFLFEYKKEYFHLFIQIIIIIAEIYICLNFILIILYPNGMYISTGSYYVGKIWILGYKSSLQYYTFPLLVLTFIKSTYKRKFTNYIFVCILIHIECIMSSNSMLFVGLLMWDVCVVLGLYKKNILTKKMMIFVFSSIIFLNILIVFYTAKFLSNSLVKSFMFEVLNKDSTFSMRTGAWEATVKAICDKPFFGHGYTSRAYRSVLFNRHTAHSHNLFLELLFENGIIGLLIYLKINYEIFKNMYKANNNGAKIMFIAIAILYLMYIFENIFQKSSVLLWMLFVLGYYSSLFDDIQNNKSFDIK